jgi:D-3-phosphoglycerate dehydrogenase
MLREIEEFRAAFTARGIELITPNVVQVMSEDELVQLVPLVDGWIIGDDPATERVFFAGKSGNLKAAVKWGVGVDNVDFNACEKLEIPITNTPNMFGGEVADMALAYLLGLARDSYYVHEEVKKGNWVKPTGSTVAGSTIAVVGLGDIGKNTIKRLNGFEVKIIAYDPFSAHTAEDLGIDAILDFPERIEEADFVVLTPSLTESSKHIINKASLSKMKVGVRIVNVSRGGLIKESDLITALKSGKVRSVALDVFEEEPLSMANELLTFSQNIFGSHNGSNTKEAVHRASHEAMDKLFEFLGV